MTDRIRLLQVLDDIASDMKNDAVIFDGKPFDGRTVAEYFGNQGAAIAALANILKELIEPEGERNDQVAPTFRDIINRFSERRS